MFSAFRGGLCCQPVFTAAVVHISRMFLWPKLYLISHQLTERAWSGHKSERALRPGSREVPPRPGRTKCELHETLQFLIMGAGKETSINLPCLLILASSWTVSPSHSYSSELQAKGGHCAARPSCLSDGVRDRKERITWSCATKRSCFRPFYELPLQRSS